MKHYSGEISKLLPEYSVLAQKEAAAFRPPSDAVHIDQHESKVLSKAEQYLAEEQRIYDTVVTDVSNTAADVSQKLYDLSNVSEQVIKSDHLSGKVDAEIAGERQKIVAAKELRIRADADISAFRAINHISSQAVYPDSHVWHIGIVAIFALAETVINAFFYENAQGLLGGFTIALAVAVVNMASAFVLGIWCRYKNLQENENIIKGWLCVIVFVLFSIYCNALFSAFRSEYQILSDPTNVFQVRKAFGQALVQARGIYILDMKFADLISFVLFGFGLMLSGLAFWKGYTLDDKYPGYGARDRRYKEALKNELDKIDELRKIVKETLEKFRTEILDIMHMPSQLSATISKCIGDLQMAIKHHENAGKAIQRDFSLVLKSYRHENTAVRKTEPPAYFSELIALDVALDTENNDTMITELEALRVNIDNIRDKYQDPLNTKLKDHQNESSDILTHRLTEFLLETEKEAKDNIERNIPSMPKGK